jgi:shikimate 5-dehydrogenase
MELRAMPWHESIIEAELAKTKLVVNATSIGLITDESPVPAEIIPPDLLALDLIYSRTHFLRDAEAAGCTVADGELMLLHQGAAAFTLWTGKPAPLELMREKLHEARAGGLRSAEGEPAGDEPGDGAVDAGAAAGSGASSAAPD